MGNKLCAPLLSKKAHTQHSQPWHSRKDSNLLRLWAEIFCVQTHGDFMQWKRVSEDVVPINITCVEDTPKTVFQVTAYNRHVEKVFDIKITQPGTILCPATDCFVHWRDLANNSEWGLNFTTPQDAKRFRDCCSVTNQKFARKAASANSLRLSPIKDKGNSVSSPNSPVHDPRQVISSPYDLNQVQPCECITPSGERELITMKDKAATIPRMQTEAGANGLTFQPKGILKQSLGAEGSGKLSSDMANKKKDSCINNNTCQSTSAITLLNIDSNKETGHVKRNLFSQSPSKTCTNVGLDNAFIGNYENSCDLDQGSSSRHVAMAKKQNNVNEKEAWTSDECENQNTKVVKHKDCIRILTTQKLFPESPHNGHGSQNLLPESPHSGRGSLHSESPEWPSPPEPLTPQTPQTPTYHLKFDSDSIKRMLQNLPFSPETDSTGNKFNENEKVFDEYKGGTCGYNELVNGGVQSQNLGNPLLLDSELGWRKCIHDRSSYGRDSNPDSGIGGMMGELALSLSSGDANTGLDVRQNHNGQSTGASSHNSSSGSHHSQSDLISQFTDGQFLSSEMSDDDAGSDDSIHTVTEAESQFSYAKQHGAIRKAGWLIVKNWLVQKKKKLELAPRRRWKKYWVCLKGTVLLLYDGDIDNITLDDNVPRHMLVIEGGIAQAVPEHPKRDNIFSLSTAFGDAYLLQASSQMELDSWVCAVHSACAGSFARQHGKENIVRLLRSELQKLDTNIDIDIKMRKMAELQLTVVCDPRSRQAIISQICQWEENIEKLFIEQYRLQCYSSSIQGSELPNPNVLLSSVSKASKMTLSKLGVFTVSSFHALVCARKPLVIPSLYGKGNQKRGLLYPRGDGSFRYPTKTSHVMSPVSQNVHKATEIEEAVCDMVGRDGNQPSADSTGSMEMLSKVTVLNNQTITVDIKKHTTAEDVLMLVCNKRQLDPRGHYVRVQLQGAPEGSYHYPNKHDNIKNLKCEQVQVCQKYHYQMELRKSESIKDYGLKIEAELAEDCDKEDLRIYVVDIRPDSLADIKGLKPGDEILTINGRVVSDLDMVYVESLLTESQSINVTVRSMFVPTANMFEPPAGCSPSSPQTHIGEVSIENIKIPTPSSAASSATTSHQNSPQCQTPKPKLSSEQVDALLQGADQVTTICKESGDESVNINRQLSEVERLRKVIMELVDTERAYVKDLDCLLECYLEPMKEEMFLTSEEIDFIFGNIQEIAHFQRQFLLSLEEAMQLDSPFFHGTDIKHYRRVLFSLGGSFLFYANHFKVYSSFCASHSRSQKILNPDTINERLKKFLIARNPKNQHSSTLDSYLIKPIQRILKYPLLLQQLCNLTDPETDEHHHLSGLKNSTVDGMSLRDNVKKVMENVSRIASVVVEARKGMEAVAEHINEMQKIYEEYGAIFDELSKMFRDLYPSKQAVDLSVGELQMYGTVEWCNVNDSLGKVKKGTELESTVFVFKTGVVFLCRERLKRRKAKPVPSSGRSLFSDSYDTSERFRTLIPVHDVQVRIGKVSDIDGHYWWELVHSRSDVEGRPERVYRFCNSTNEAKTDFMRIIRQTIRDSVRKMAVPNNQQTAKNKYIPYGGKRLEALTANSRSTLSKKRISPNNKPQDVERHSMELEEKFQVNESDGAFRIRSKTIGDLKEVSSEDLDEEKCIVLSEPDNVELCEAGSENSSCSNLSISSNSASSAKLTFSSANPLKYLSSQEHMLPIGSPIWKPRNEKNALKQRQIISHPPVAEEADPKVLLTSSISPSDLVDNSDC